MRHQLKSLVIAGGLSLALAAPATAAEIFFDSFENPQTGSWAVYQNNVGDNGDWESVGGAGIEIQNESLGITDAFDGEQYVELDSDNSRGGVPGNTNSVMAADVGMIAGRTYEISFAYQPRTNNGNDDNGIALFSAGVHGAGASLNDLLFFVSETTSTLGDWMVYTVIYTAEANVNGLAFAAFGNDNSLGGFIDAVRVSEVPIPAALPLFGLGLAGLAGLRRRQRRA